MDLSRNVVQEFVTITNDSNQAVSSNTIYGTIVEYNGSLYAQLDGSNTLTPVSTTASYKTGDRVLITISNHTATITGNMSDPSASGSEVTVLGSIVADKANISELNAQIANIENLIADEATIENLKANNANIGDLKADKAEVKELTAQVADINNLKADKATIDELNAEIADIKDLKADKADVEELTAENGRITNLEARNAVIDEQLVAHNASIENLDAVYLNVDFGNIDQAWMEEFYAKSGLVEYITADEVTVTGHLVGVTITGDLIEGGTIKADKLVIKDDETGLYYKLNFEAGKFKDAEEVPTDSLHGSVITTNTITAEKISVSDLIAFDATIGGFNIGDGSIYSGVKESIDNSTKGIYLDTDGQVSFGDGSNYIKYYKTTDENGNEVYKLEIAADSILFGDGVKNSISDIKDLTEHVKIGTCINPETGDEVPSIELSEGDTDFKLRLTNTNGIFMDDDNPTTVVDTHGLSTENVKVKNSFRHGGFIWTCRESGNLGLIWNDQSYVNNILHFLHGFTEGEGTHLEGAAYYLGETKFSAQFGDIFVINTSRGIRIPHGCYLKNRFGTTSITGEWAEYDMGIAVSQKSNEMRFEYDYYPYEYKINYELNGGVNHPDNPTTYNVLYPQKTIKDPTREGWSFYGWSTTSDGSILFRNNNSTVINDVGNTNNNFPSVDLMREWLGSRMTGDITLYAHWHQ